MGLPQKLFIFMGFSILAACQPAAIAPTSPPPAPITVAAAPVIPARPLPPLGAAASLTVPPLDVDGTRSSPNKGIGPEETLWHVRSSFNVSALICQGAKWGRLARDYNVFLKKHESRLRIANRAIEAKFQRENRGTAGRRARDTHITSLYNYFSLPPVKTRFCNTMLIHADEMAALNSADLKDYAATTLPKIDAIFTDFYDSYEAYQKALADWQAKYGDQSS